MHPLVLLTVVQAVVGAALCQDLKWSPIWPGLSLQDKEGAQPSKHWVVLVAGSSEWYNYRHQADVCHAYQIVKKHGIPDDQIITMMYDDIANNPENPTPGIIINRPNGSDVYAGVRIDYKGDDVTPENFLQVLNGTGSGKVLKSGPDDFVFINFVDHGAPGLIGFPNGYLNAKPLIDTLLYMHKKKMYKKLVFYLEACESGSMFDQLLPPNASIYSTTASDPYESSYACYYDDKRDTYLGDVYSVNWMEDSDAKDISQETLDDQLAFVKQKTNTSHVMKYGDMALGDEKVGEFQGKFNDETTRTEASTLKTDAVSQRDAQMVILEKRLAKTKTESDRVILSFLTRQLKQKRAKIARVFDDIIARCVKSPHIIQMIRYPLTNFDCHHRVVDEIHKRCFNLGQIEEALRHIFKIVNLCESRISTARIIDSVRQVCKTHLRL